MNQSSSNYKQALIKLCNVVEKDHLKSHQLNDSYRYLRFSSLGDDDTDLALSESLTCFKTATLWIIFPHVGAARKAVLMALDASVLIPFHKAIAKIAKVSPYDDLSTYCFENDYSTSGQYFNQKLLAKVSEGVSSALIQAYLKSLLSSKLGYRNLATMVNAYLGNNQAKIEKGLLRFDQPSIKAWGLLPFESQQQIAQRYVSFERMKEDSIQFYNDRWDNIQAAIQVGLKNLSTRAGYTTLKALREDLEDAFEQERVRYLKANPVAISEVLFKSHRIAQWEVKIVISGLKPVLIVKLKNKKKIEPPETFMQTPEYTVYADAVAQLEKIVLPFKKIKPYVKYVSFFEFDNGEEVRGQVIDQALLEQSIADLPKSLLLSYLFALKNNDAKYYDLVLMIEAFIGINRKQLEKGLVRHGQLALKAYGLLPVESRKELLQRYQTLKKAWKEATQYGAERQANTRAAVQVSLANLATRAGYPDATRLEWDLEGDISRDAQALFEFKTLDQWEVKLGLEGIKPILQVYKKGKKLKTVPAGLRKNKHYADYRAVINQLKEQARRFRGSLEEMMINKETVDRDALKKLLRMPVMPCLLGSLLGINEHNEVGFINTDSLMLTDGDQHYAIKESLRLVHTHDLFKLDVLSYWQQQIVHQQIVQPFKQVFRELYLLTPAEQETKTYTNRFSHRQVEGAMAYRLLQSRGWSQGELMAIKKWPAHQLQAHWEFPDLRYYMAANDKLMSHRLSFFPQGDFQSTVVPLNKVCPIIFSETLRDADLVVSVAKHANSSGFWSSEVQQHRISVAKHIAENLGISTLRFEDKYVIVTGEWNEYRIHLGTANAYLGGQHLCIGAGFMKKGKAIYLPFADTDMTTSEMIAKILLLKNDSKI